MGSPAATSTRVTDPSKGAMLSKLLDSDTCHCATVSIFSASIRVPAGMASLATTTE
ncbi:hypothetical protein D3C73_804820 [compost metagenome]